jgi:hypothetical protein
VDLLQIGYYTLLERSGIVIAQRAGDLVCDPPDKVVILKSAVQFPAISAPTQGTLVWCEQQESICPR